MTTEEKVVKAAALVNQNHPTIGFTKAPSYWIRSVPYIAGVQWSNTEVDDEQLIDEAKKLGWSGE
jgi:hypothetical protein